MSRGVRVRFYKNDKNEMLIVHLTFFICWCTIRTWLGLFYITGIYILISFCTKKKLKTDWTLSVLKNSFTNFGQEYWEWLTIWVEEITCKFHLGWTKWVVRWECEFGWENSTLKACTFWTPETKAPGIMIKD